MTFNASITGPQLLTLYETVIATVLVTILYAFCVRLVNIFLCVVHYSAFPYS